MLLFSQTFPRAENTECCSGVFMESRVTNAGALAEGKSQGCAVSPPGYCHGSEWLIGNETRAGDCAVMAAELCPQGCVVR